MRATNPHEELARERKVSRLAFVVCRVKSESGSLTPASVIAERFTATDRRLAERMGGVKPCSDTTWQLTIERLREQESRS